MRRRIRRSLPPDMRSTRRGRGDPMWSPCWTSSPGPKGAHAPARRSASAREGAGAPLSGGRGFSAWHGVLRSFLASPETGAPRLRAFRVTPKPPTAAGHGLLRSKSRGGRGDPMWSPFPALIARTRGRRCLTGSIRASESAARIFAWPDSRIRIAVAKCSCLVVTARAAV